MSDSEPTIIRKQAIDVTPNYHGIWCSIAGGAPFVNPIVHRVWSDDGTEIVWGLDSHNCDFHAPDEWVAVVELNPDVSEEMRETWRRHDERAMRPPEWYACPQCKGSGKVRKTRSTFDE